MACIVPLLGITNPNFAEGVPHSALNVRGRGRIRRSIFNGRSQGVGIKRVKRDALPTTTRTSKPNVERLPLGLSAFTLSANQRTLGMGRI
jgi:hypothetical protein